MSLKWALLFLQASMLSCPTQVTAMEERANKVGIPNTLHYMFPDNGYLNVNPNDWPGRTAFLSLSS